MASLILLLSYTVIAGLLYLAYIIYTQFTYWARRQMLHAKPVPLLGSSGPLFFRTSAFCIYAQDMYEAFPGARYYGYFDFKRPAVLLKEPDLIREVCIKSFEHFVDHDAFVTEEMDPIVGRNLFSLQGQRWKDLRNTLTPSFTVARMKVLFQLIAECSRDFVQYFLDNPEIAKNFEAKEAFTRYTSDVIATSAFGIKVDSMKDQQNEFFLHGQATTAATPFFILKFELMNVFPKLMRLVGATFLPKDTDCFFKKLISETVRIRREKGIVRQDMIQLLMQAMDKESGPKVTVDDIVAQAFFFFLAGFDTTSSLMCFCAHELAANPEIQEKLHREIDERLEQDGGEISYESLTKIKYLDMVISETLRLYPVAPLTNRVCTKEHVLPAPMDGYGKCRIEKNTVVLIPIYGLHRDAKYFPEPEKFEPERFSDENKQKIKPYVYMPFGIGPRQCIGNRFALMEVKIVVAHILSKFVIKFTEKSERRLVYDKKNFSMRAKNGFWLNFEERKKSA